MLDWILHSLIPRPFLVLYLVAVVISTLYGGWGPGLLVAALSTLKIRYFHTLPLYSFSLPSLKSSLALGLFLLIAVLVMRFVEWTHEKYLHAEAGRRELHEFLNSLGGIIAWEANALTLQYHFVTQSTHRLLKYSSDDWFREPAFLARHTHPDDKQRLSEMFERVLRGEKDQAIDHRIIDAEGKSVWFHTAVHLDEQGHYPKLRGATIEISPLKKAQEALLESERRLTEERNRAEKYFECVSVMMLVLSADGRVVKINQRGCEILECDKNTIIGKDWIDTVIPERIRDEIRTVFRKSVAEKNVGLIRFRESPILTQSGVERIIAWHHTLLFDEDQNAVLSLSSGEDITERKKAEASLKESEAKFKSLADDALVGIFMVQDWHYIYANPFLARILGYSVEELLNLKNWLHIVAPDERSTVVKLVENLGLVGESSHREARLLKKDGTLLDIEGIAAVTHYKGKSALVGTVVDISERRRLETQRGEFYAMLTHDLKNPLTTIVSCAELLLAERRRFDDRTNRLITMIQGGGKTLSRLVEDYLAVSQGEEGKLGMKCVPTDLSWILQESQRNLQEAIQKKNLNLTIEIAANLPKALVDEKLLQRALSNLLQNAVNYTPSGGKIQLKADWIAGRDSDDILISVSDTGVGIPQAEQENIFSKYYRSARTTDVKGTGLGLAIVRNVAEAHGGYVKVRSEVDKGSTFTLCLPVGMKRGRVA